MTWIEKTQGEDQDRDTRKPIERVAAKVAAALKGDEEAKIELGWNQE